MAIPAGATVPALAAANRDERMFDGPELLDVERANAARHVAFSLGESHCPGAGLSRLEQVIALKTMVSRLPRLRLLPGQTFDHHPNFTLRALKELRIGFEPVGSI